jgi:hypothetical protein
MANPTLSENLVNYGPDMSYEVTTVNMEKDKKDKKIKRRINLKALLV